MPSSKCFVLGCKTNYASDIKKRKSKGEILPSVFRPPKDPALLEKWQRAVQRADKVLSRKDVVCDLHFLKDEVERNYVTKLPDGTVHLMERGCPTLKRGAVPSIFPNLSKCDIRKRQLTENTFTKEDYKKVKFCQVKAIKCDGYVEVPKNKYGNGHENNISISDRNEYEINNCSISDRNEHETNNCSFSDRNGHETNNCSFSDRNGHETNNCSFSDRNGHGTNNFPFSDRNGHQTNNISSDRNGHQTNNISSDRNADETNDFSSSDRSKDATNNFSFSDLIQNLGSIQKHKWWAITQHKNFLICVKWDDGFKAQKKIILDDDLKSQVYVYDRQVFNVQPENLNSLEDVSALLKTVDSCTCCASLAKGYKEPNCEILIKQNENGRPKMWCKSCKAIRRHTDDQSPKKTPGRKETITRKQLYQQFVAANKKVLRLRKKVKAMQQRIDDLQRALKDKKMESLQNDLKSKNITQTPRKISSVFLDC